MSTQLPLDVLTGVPDPQRARWQPLRAGILNLFRYDEQVFAFHRGRLLLRGNNGTGKSMALEVLLPFVLDAELTPTRLSTFGGRDRNMYLWLIGFDKTGTRSSERAYVWVEFGRRLRDGSSEFFTAGAMVEATRSSEVRPTYFTTAARVALDLDLGRAGTEPLNRQQLSAALAEHAEAGRPGRVHPDARTHRRVVNETLYGLNDRRFDALRSTLLQLRRPKLSDKLDGAGLDVVLRNSLPPIADGTVADLAEGFERLDRHAAAIDDLSATVEHLRTLHRAYRRYARVVGAARADAVAAAESALDTIRDGANTAERVIAAARSALERIAESRGKIAGRTAAIAGEREGLTKLEAYRRGQDVEPLRDLVAHLLATAEEFAETARRDRLTAAGAAAESERATSAAIGARDTATEDRTPAAAAAAAANLTDLDAELAAGLHAVLARDVADHDELQAVLTEAGPLLTRLEAGVQEQARTAGVLVRLAGSAHQDAEAVAVARGETESAESDARDAEAVLNRALEADAAAVGAHLDALTTWADASPQLRAGQAPPLPWDAETALARAPRWAAEARAARTDQLLEETERLEAAAAHSGTRAGHARDAAHRLDDLAAAVVAATAAAAACTQALGRYAEQVRGWFDGLVELPSGAAVPDLATLAHADLATTVTRWADDAATARSRVLVTEQARLRAAVDETAARIAGLLADEERLAAGGLPEVPAPATRAADRGGRAGAPLFRLVDFAADVPAPDRRGLEAAAVGSGLADAWVSPDGTLLAAADGSPLRDTQLNAAGQAHSGTTLADVLHADVDPSTGVPTQVVTALLARVGVAASALHADGLVLGRDGSWRAGTLTGAHVVDKVTLIGAANREAARLAALEAVRALLVTVRADLDELADQDRQLTAALAAVDAERAAVPADTQVRERKTDADTAAAAVREAVPGVAAAVAVATQPLDDAADGPVEVATGWEGLAGPITADPGAPDILPALRATATSAVSLERARTGRAERLRTAAGERRALVAGVGAEAEARPPADDVHATRTELATARANLAGSVDRLAGRRERESVAVGRAHVTRRAAAAAVSSAGLPDGCDVDALASAVHRYGTLGVRWLRAGVDAVRAEGTATIAAALVLSSDEDAHAASERAATQARRHRSKAEELRVLSENYGAEFSEIVSRLSGLDTERKSLDAENAALGSQELERTGERVRAETELATTERLRQEADVARDAAIAAFLAAARAGVLTAGTLPDAAAGESSDTPELLPGVDPAQRGSLGRRAVRNWARAVREAAGDRPRDVDAVERAANAVTTTRYELEPQLSGRVSVRDEQRDGLLLLHAGRGTDSLSLLQMIALMDRDLARDRALLADHEADLFRTFLADSTRREVTTKVRDARTAIKQTSDLMAAHPTGSGLQVRLRWRPDEQHAPGMQEIVSLMAKDAPLDSEKERLQDFFRARVAQVRASADSDYKAQMAALLDYRQWWRFVVEFRRGPSESWEALTSKAHGSLSGGEKAVCLHLPLFAAAASYCDSAGMGVDGPDGTSGAPRLILLDEVFAGVDEDNRGELFEIIRTLDLDLVATSESELGLYEQLDGLAVYQLVAGEGAVLAARTVWDGRIAHRLLDSDLDTLDADNADLFSRT